MSDWVKAREFSSRFEAEMARARLESADIPTTIKAHEAGIFGAGFQGAVPSGVELHVPSDRLSEVQTILDDALDSSSEEP
jgi:hypothetical protein